MPYKTILIHCNDERSIEGLLAPAVNLAESFQSHVIALSVAPPVSVVSAGAPNGPPIVLDEHCKVYRERNPVLRSAFEAATRKRGLVGEWREDEANAFGVTTRVLEYARACDLVIASQKDSDWPWTDLLDVPDRLAIESGRPVLIVPRAAEAPDRMGEKVLVAWNGRREATRAVYDALPILKSAKEVKVIWINPQLENEVALDIPAADICASLARHNVRCEATEQVKPRGSVGEMLLAAAKEMEADLLVMGCYGHTRLRELVFGGASRHVLAHTPLPVLMSH
jgi:nucleotide-binding universal stress UspA family protein